MNFIQRFFRTSMCIFHVFDIIFSDDGVKIMIKATGIRRLFWNNPLLLTLPYLGHPHLNWKENIILRNKSTTEIKQWILTIFDLSKHCEQKNKKEETLLNNHWILIKQRHMNSNRNISKGIEFGKSTAIGKSHRMCSVNWFLKRRKTAQWTVLPWSIAFILMRACSKCRLRDIQTATGIDFMSVTVFVFWMTIDQWLCVKCLIKYFVTVVVFIVL